MDVLSENIVAKFYSPYPNSFDGRVPSSIIDSDLYNTLDAQC